MNHTMEKNGSLKTTTYFLIALFYILLVVGFFHREILAGHCLIASDSIYAFFPWSDLATSAPRFQNFDVPLQFHPWRTFSQLHFLNGKIPLWNPHAFCGSPFIGNIQAQVFSPLEFPSVLLSPEHSFLFSAMMKIFIACFGAFLLADRLKFSVLTAMTTGAIYGYSGLIILWLQYPQAAIAAYTPWALLAIEYLLKKPGVRPVIGLTIVTAFQLLTGHPEMSVYLLGFIIAYTSIRLIQIRLTHESIKKIVFCSLIGLLMGIMLAMVIYLPFVEYLANSMVYHARGHKQMSESTLAPVCLHLLVMPRLFGSPAHSAYYFPALFPNDVNSATYGELTSPYFGMWSLFLALIGLIFCLRHRHPLLAYAVCGSFVAMLIYGVPGPGLIIGAIPIIKLGFILRTVFIFNLCGAILAGFGLEILSTAISRHRRWIAVGSFGFLAVILTQLSRLSLQLAPALQRFQYTLLWNQEVNFTTLILGVGAGVILISCIKQFRRITIILPVLILVELFRFGFGYNASVPQERIAPSHPVLEAIAADEAQFRMTGISSAMFPNMAMVYDLLDTRGYDALTPEKYYRFAEAFDPSLVALRNANNPAYMLMNATPGKLLKLLNVKYVVHPVQPGQHPKSDSKSLPGLIELPEQLSRFYCCGNYSLFTDNDRELARLTSPAFTPGNEITLRKLPDYSPSIIAQPDQFTINETFRSTNEIRLTAQSTHATILASSEPFFPGWKAWVNDEPTEILACNHAFRAVVIPKANSTIVYRYEPVSFRLGLFCSLLALAMIVFTIIFHREKFKFRLSTQNQR